MATQSEVLKHFLSIRKSSYKYAPVFQKVNTLLSGTKKHEGISELRSSSNGRLGVRVVLGEKSDLALCQSVDSIADRLRLGKKVGLTVQPAKSPSVYYGNLASQRNRYSVPSELKYTESSYSSRSIFIWLWTDLQQECPDIYQQIVIGNAGNAHVYSFGHVYNDRTQVKNVGGIDEFLSWLEGRTNLFSKNPKLETRLSNIYVFFSDNFLEMFPTNYNHVFDKVREVLGNSAFVRFAYASRYPITYNSLATYSYPSITDLFSQKQSYNKYLINVLENVQRQDYSETLSNSSLTVRLLCHSTLLRADQPTNELVVAQKTPAEDNVGLAYLDKFNDYKSSIDSIFVAEYDRLKALHPHDLLAYSLALLTSPSTTVQNILDLCPNLKVTESQKEILLKQVHTKLLEEVMTHFDNDPQRLELVRSLAFGTPELITELRKHLWHLTSVQGSAFNIVKAKTLLRRILSFPELSAASEYYEFQAQGPRPNRTKLASMALTSNPSKFATARVPRSTDSFWKIDCEFVRHSISLRGHINEVNKKHRMSWCKLAPEV